MRNHQTGPGSRTLLSWRLQVLLNNRKTLEDPSITDSGFNVELNIEPRFALV
jgi:hypothetical protein